jgi:IPT/TIG domain
MKRAVLFMALLAVGLLATVGAQSAAADVPTLTGFAPTSGPPDWVVTLTGTGFTGAVGVTFAPTDSTYWPEAAMFTVASDTSIVATVPFIATRPLTATLTVDGLDGSVTSASDFAVDGEVGLSEHRGASGEPITLTGSGFTGATQVIFGTWGSQPQGDEPFSLAAPVAAHFTVLKDTKIAATVPALRVGGRYWVAVLSPAGTSVTDHASPFLVMKPLLLKDEGGDFATRPATVTPSGDGSFFIAGARRGHGIRWRSWSAARAYGLATVWIDNGIPEMARGTFHGYHGSITATRARSGRFTRMAVRWEKKGHVHYERLMLKHTGGSYLWSGWFWQ